MKCNNEISAPGYGATVQWHVERFKCIPLVLECYISLVQLQPKQEYIIHVPSSRGGKQHDTLSFKFQNRHYYRFAFSNDSEITAVKCNIRTMRNAFLVIWGGGLVFVTPFGAPVSMLMHLYLMEVPKLCFVILAVLIHIQSHHLACYVYWKLGLVLICVHSEYCCVSF